MQFGFFRIPLGSAEAHVEELNRFLRTHRILNVQRELVQESGSPCWAVCVEYLEPVAGGSGSGGQQSGTQKPKIDYREVLSQADFAVFSRLRQLRKELAERDGQPVYAIFTNEQLAAMVTGKVTTLAGMKAIEGVGDARIEKYGAPILAVLQNGTTLPPEPASVAAA
jgi:superfamily II DNA helicase RecQ